MVSEGRQSQVTYCMIPFIGRIQNWRIDGGGPCGCQEMGKDYLVDVGYFSGEIKIFRN